MVNISNIENEVNHNTWFISIVLIVIVIGVIAYAKIKVNRNR